MKKKTDPVRSDKITANNRKMFFLACFVATITFFSFFPALKNNFINWDDNAYVFENEHLTKPLWEATGYFFGLHYFIGNYIPLTMIVYSLEYHATGFDPHFFHKANVLMHLLNVLLVFWFVYLLSGKKPLVAGLVSLFFGIHPMHVESVAWISELKDVLYTFFFIAGLISYYKYVEKKSATFNLRGLLLTLFFFVLSSLSKPAAVVFPIVLLLIDFYTGRKSTKWLWLEKIPFFVFSIVFGLIALKAQHADRLIHDEYTFTKRLFFASHSVLEYVFKLFYPFKLSIFYPYPKITEGSLPFFYYLSPAILILLFFIIYKTLKYSRLIAFGFLFFLVNIALVLQLISVGDAIMSDRYTYVSYLGLFFIAGMGIDKFYHGTSEKIKKYKPIILAVIILLTIISASTTYARCKVWRNDDTIATDLISKFPDDRLALNNKGFILFNQQRYQESVDLFTKAIRIRTDYVMAYINLINSYLALNDYNGAMKTADTALRYVQDDYHLLNKKGNLLAMQRKYDEAIGFYNRAIKVNTENTRGYIFLAECYYELKDYDKGLQTIEMALAYEPNNYILLNNKGYFLFLKEKYNEAVDYFKACLQQKPDYNVASVNLENCYRAMNNKPK